VSEKEQFLKTWDREFQTTMKVLKAYPQDKGEFKPHERSRSARELAWNFVLENGFADHALNGKLDFSRRPPEPPARFQDILPALEKAHRELADQVKGIPEGDLRKTVKFPVAPKTMADLPRMDVLWAILMDSIHHRGQFSVYLRMAGGKVPSIYGPSADEPWM
jgi:uncharacterized damage-inducible protein DinB